MKNVAVIALGMSMGFVISAIGFGSYEQTFAMFTFSSLRMFLAFVGAVALSSALYPLLARNRPLPARCMHGGVVVGSLMFGAGWFVSGACPGVAFAQLGQGKLWAAITIAGMAVGVVGWRELNQRLFHIPADSCGD